LRARDDFRELIRDLDFPADPFARWGGPGPADGRLRARRRRGPGSPSPTGRLRASVGSTDASSDRSTSVSSDRGAQEERKV